MNAVVEGPHLTPREADIVDLVCAHLTHGAIAGQLGISRRTDEWHIDKILRELPLDIGYSPMRRILRFDAPVIFLAT
jgi:DNA-binding CsgD family transcriptional regulator